MRITERQAGILNIIVEEYINSFRPVSSELLEKKYNFGICPATIRIELQKLTNCGYLYQPHTSAGRIPTDKGYRFFVNNLIEKEFLNFSENFEFQKRIKKELNDVLKFSQVITKYLSSLCSNLVLGYLISEKILWKEGWEKILQKPEFQNPEYILKFTEMLKIFEENIEQFKNLSKVQVYIYIGKENPFPKARDFSTIITKYHLIKEHEGILAILGPKRMIYSKNIGLVNSLTKLLNSY